MKPILMACLTLLWAGSSFASCETQHYQAFDFWLGQWRVETASGKLAGHNRIEKTLNGCVVTEHYTTAKGYEGNSLNIYDRQTGQWHQTWMDNSGLLLQLDGGMVDNAMVLQGQGKNAQGEPVTHRITWTPNPNGTVRQHWESSTDSGVTWQTLFDGTYYRDASD
ncbi:hypothetical protein LJ739_13515 [Aestuariibacter halophilus]|uniref:DUF1579 domain-containing protein n=1 Tax=Fluctibacter halophilus TaxID=226011 RepID=A0ABS8GDJ6_9ALTE|nr:hypothetical protein [Aestuariibacter halophilus]MCC2617266.1 hypothetical protein [Aestuariibacter halophilus]